MHGVLVHIMGAEWIWLRRWQGESPRRLLQPADYPDFEALAGRWSEVDAELRAFVAVQTQESLVQEIHYTNTQGKAFSGRLWELMAHVVNHSTHHRGELAAMYTALGVLHEEEDLLFYFLGKERTGRG